MHILLCCVIYFLLLMWHFRSCLNQISILSASDVCECCIVLYRNPFCPMSIQCKIFLVWTGHYQNQIGRMHTCEWRPHKLSIILLSTHYQHTQYIDICYCDLINFWKYWGNVLQNKYPPYAYAQTPTVSRTPTLPPAFWWICRWRRMLQFWPQILLQN